MVLVGRNILLNLIGRGVLTLLTLVITPLQVNLLGLEAYAVVGFISTLQIAFIALDLGLSSTVTRELASDQSPGRLQSRDLLRTAATVYWLAAVVIGIVLAALAEPIATRWFTASELDSELLEQSLRLIALYLALRWPTALYTGVLAGLQRMDVLNAMQVGAASLRLIGGVAVLLYWRSLGAFLWWTALNALLEVVAYALACRRVHPAMPMWPGVSASAVGKVWRFSASMNVLTLSAVLIVQLDRLFLSKMLTLDDLGLYTLAYTVASTITLLVSAISTAVLPSLAAIRSKDSPAELRDQYARADRAMLFVVGLPALALVFHGEAILAVWINPAAAAGAAGPLALLAVGFWCSAVIANVYNVAVASGMLSRYLKVNLLGIGPYALGLYALIEHFGKNGAAGAWLLLNVAYGCLLVPSIHRKVLGISTWRWLTGTVLPFAMLGLVVFAVPYMGLALGHESTLRSGAALLVGGLLYVSSCYVLLGAYAPGKLSDRSLLTGLRRPQS